MPNYKQTSLIRAATEGNLPAMKEVAGSLTIEEIREALAADADYAAFRKAAENGHLDVLQQLAIWAPNQLSAMIAANNYDAFYLAASNVHLAVLDQLKNWSSDNELQAMIAANGLAVYDAASNGYTDILKRLEIWAPGKLPAIIEEYGALAFISVAKKGYLDVLKQLATWAPNRNKLSAIISANRYVVFRVAAENGHLDVLEQLKNWLSDDDKFQAISEVFFEAAKNGHLGILEQVKNWLSDDDKLQAMILGVFREAAKNGHLGVLEQMKNWLSDDDKLQAMISSDNYGAFREAAKNGHLDILKQLAAWVPDKLSMISARNYNAFSLAASYNHSPVINYLLAFPLQLAYAEMHQQEYHEYVIPFIERALVDLRARRGIFESANPHGVFNLDDTQDAKLYFYMLRNLIRRNDPALLDDIRFLLDLPAVKALAHTEVTAGQANELLRLALSTQNQAAASILLNIPAIRALAAQNGYYREEQRGGTDVAQLARDRESSMTALTEGELKRLSAVSASYQPLIDAAGIMHVMQDLRNTLQGYYEAQPAFIITQEQVRLDLPFDLKAFQELNLPPADKKNALQAYYQNIYHTAFRYLSRPNPLIDPNALYVCISDDRRERWASFEEYQPLISLLYLAANDETIEEYEGYTPEARLLHFIRELALIARAHNWDHTREKKDDQGNIVLDSKGKPLEEEYDDLNGDRPSCFSGVKRRLFQAVQGHPLLSLLSRATINAECNQFIRQHFETEFKKIHQIPGALQQIQDTWNTYVIDLDEEAGASLKQFDMSSEAKEQFMQQMKNKYGEQLTIDFIECIETKFSLEDRGGVKHLSLFSKYSEQVQLDSLLARLLKEDPRIEVKEDPRIEAIKKLSQDYLAHLLEEKKESSSPSPLLKRKIANMESLLNLLKNQEKTAHEQLEQIVQIMNKDFCCTAGKHRRLISSLFVKSKGTTFVENIQKILASPYEAKNQNRPII